MSYPLPTNAAPGAGASLFTSVNNDPIGHAD